VVEVHLLRFLAMIDAAAGAPGRQLTAVEAQAAATRLYAQVQAFANNASFEIPIEADEDKIAKVLGARVLYPSDLRQALGAVDSLLQVLQDLPPETGRVRRRNRIARKQIYLSLAFFFSEGAGVRVCVKGCFFFMRGGHFFFFFTVARRNFAPQQKVVPTQKTGDEWRTVQTELSLETTGLTQAQMRFVFCWVFFVVWFLCGGCTF
jgi:hypothetical protein